MLLTSNPPIEFIFISVNQQVKVQGVESAVKLMALMASDLRLHIRSCSGMIDGAPEMYT